MIFSILLFYIKIKVKAPLSEAYIHMVWYGEVIHRKLKLLSPDGVKLLYSCIRIIGDRVASSTTQMATQSVG